MFMPYWAAANGGVTNVLVLFGLFLPFSAFSGGSEEHQKTQKNGLLPGMSSDLLKAPSLKTPLLRYPNYISRPFGCPCL